ncbi:penicillin-binding protein 2 [Patescibacteria group bacterium]|nr:penicillin-binding protein 2 [Patescibacteria group bacterium]MBU4000468.1 penicillin-binding protein 2 [Patescibacteria group bacterium]MBU4056707.1 penicillin-binding protein 2 [Patescibacteria group bacterium]MBU4368177.1 penicillin-binding protein 2 [Patescibacteria group bacterium]
MTEASSSDKRISLLLVIFFLLAAAILSRMFYWQVLKHSVYIALAEGQRSVLSKLFPTRGEIFISDKGGSDYFPVAMNKPGYLVYAVPIQIKDARSAAASLSKILELPEKEIEDRLSRPGDQYEIISRRVSEETVSKIKSLNLKGIQSESENWRYWPENNFLSQVLGFVGFSGNKRAGQYGIEGFFNDRLEGKTGMIEAERGLGGFPISFGTKEYNPAENGDDIVLTIDRSIQYHVETALEARSKELAALSGSAIVMEPATGKILAMANWPGFDPNEYSAVKDLSVFKNPAIQGRYEPGSVIKPFTLAIALDKKKIGPDTVYEDTGSLAIDGWTIRNSDGKANGLQTMTQVLEKSLNTGAVFASSQVDKSVFYDYFKYFGFNVPTGIELQGEIAGDLRNMDSQKEIAYANASFGQGIAITPLELITAFSGLVNGGKLMKPYIVDKIIHEDGSEEKTKPETVRQVISPESSAKISAMMVRVVEDGHAKRAAIKGYWIGGKTGTAQVPFPDKRGYSDKTIHTFAGFGPIPDPRFVILVKIDEPKNARFAESSVVPVFNDIARFMVNYLEIPANRK